MDPDQHARLTADLVAWARADARVLAVVGVGSTAGTRRRPDRWSDHDLVIVTRDDATAGELRSSTDWLPAALAPALVFQEPDHGFTVIDHGGHVLEFAIAAHDDLAWLAADVAAVLYGADVDASRAAVQAALATNRSRLRPDDAGQRFRRLVKALVTGIHRAGRGELLSAHERLRGEALALLLSLLTDSTGSAVEQHCDPFDHHRRFERTAPELAARLEAGLHRPVLEVAELLIDVAAQELSCGHSTIDVRKLEPARAALARARGTGSAGTVTRSVARTPRAPRRTHR